MLMARCRTALVATILLTATVALAQQGQSQNPRELLDDFVHYTKTGNPDLAAGNAQKLLASGLSDAELAALLDDQGSKSIERFDEAVIWTQRADDYPSLRDVAAELSVHIERGRLDLGRNPARITEAIGMLNGTLRERRLAEQRLAAAGEYGVPALLRNVVENKDAVLRTRCREMIIGVGRPAVYPLCIALPEVDPESRRAICDILGQIAYPHAAPYLREMALNEEAAEFVRDSAARAFRAVGGVDADLSSVYTVLARQYFDESQSLIAYPAEPMNNIWEYDAFTGLQPMPVPTAIFSEIRAMQTSLDALRHDSKNELALATFVASNLRRENQLPAGEDDPVYGTLNYTPDFYATVFGTNTCLEVLGMALDGNDTPLIRDAIGALSKTTGGANLLLRRVNARNPLIESLQYPDRRVQYEAALTLGGALPAEGFTGDSAVVPILASAVRTGNRSFAVVLAEDPEDVRINTEFLQNLGFDVIASGQSVQEIRQLIDQAVGVDLVLVRASRPESARRTIADLRGLPKTTVAPVLVNAGGTDVPALMREFSADTKVKVAPARVGEEALGAAIDDLLMKAAGGRITEIEAEEYAARSLQTLRDIAISGTVAYNVGDAQPSLLAALGDRRGAARLLVADILALINSDDVQRALFDAALQAQDDEQVELLERVAESIKRFGDRGEQRHLDALTQLVQNSDGDTAEAAARVHGAMNLPASQAMNFLPKN